MKFIRECIGSAIVGLCLLAGTAAAANETYTEEKDGERPPVLEYIATVVLTAGAMYAICKPARRQLV